MAALSVSVCVCVWQIAKAISDQAQSNRAAAAATAAAAVAAGGEFSNTSAFMLTD